MCDQNDDDIQQFIALILTEIIENIAIQYEQEKISEENLSNDNSSDNSFNEIKIREYLENQDEEEEGEVLTYEKFKTKHEEIKKPDPITDIPEKKEERFARFNLKQEDIDTIPFETIGYISSIVAQEIVIKSTNPKKIKNLNSFLFLEKSKHLLGTIQDVFGQVSSPYYLINFDSYLNQLVMNKEMVVGDIVIAFANDIGIPQFEIKQKMHSKGCDASNKYDEELLQNEQDFSDDEQERAAKVRKPHKNDEAFKEKQMKKKIKWQQKRQQKQNEQNIQRNQGQYQYQQSQRNPQNKFHCPQNQNLIYSNWNPQPYQQQFYPAQQQLNPNYIQQQQAPYQFIPNYQQYPNYQNVQQPRMAQQQVYWQNQQQIQPQQQQFNPQIQGMPPYQQNLNQQYYQK